MDIFEIPDDYKPQKYMTEEQMKQTTDYLVNHPLFMKQLPKDIESNPHLVALQNIIYDQQPEKLAENLNKQGNQRLKEHPNHPFYMKDAYKKYTEGIHANCSDSAINAKLHCNRAAINLKIRNFGKVIEDCKMALKYDTNYTKAYFRYASALIALKKYQQCIDLLKDRTQKQINQLKQTAILKLKQELKEIETKEKAKNSIENKMNQYCKQRGWKLQKRFQNLPSNIKAKFTEQHKLTIPIVVLYPQFSQFDIIQHTFEQDHIGIHLEQLLQNPLPWDTEHFYLNGNDLQLYVEIQEAVVMRVEPERLITQILKRCAFPEALPIILVTKASKYYQKFNSINKIVKWK